MSEKVITFGLSENLTQTSVVVFLLFILIDKQQLEGVHNESNHVRQRYLAC